MSLPLALQCWTGLSVAAARARDTGRPYAFDLAPDNGAGSNRDAALPPLDGFERVCVIDPGNPEDLLGLCKSVYTARSQGERFPESLLRVLSPASVPSRAGTAKPEPPVTAPPPPPAAPDRRPVKQAAFAFD